MARLQAWSYLHHRCYAPTNEATDSDKDRFHDELSTTTQTVPPHDELLVIGDLNAVSGEARIGFGTAVGSYGSGSMNNNSERFLSFCASFGLANCLFGQLVQAPRYSP